MQEQDFQEFPEEFKCPISLMPMQDPVMTEDGHSFDRYSIKHWFDIGKTTNPLTNLQLPSKNLIPNIALKNAINSHDQKTRSKQTTKTSKRRQFFYQSLLSQKNIAQDNPKLLQFQEKMKSNFQAYQKWRDFFYLSEKNIETVNYLKIDSLSCKGIKAIYNLKGESVKGIELQEKGIIYYEEGNIFYGFISFNLPLEGLMIEKNGTKKEGLFHFNSITFGLVTFNNEDFFFGEFSNGSPLLGIKQTHEKKLIGKFSQQAQLVKGVILYKNGEKFEGRLQDQKQVSGKLNLKNGNIFQGEFSDGVMGKGTLFYKNGNKFEGKFQFGQIFQGIFQSRSGKVFQGLFINGIPSLGKYFDQQGGQIIELIQNGKSVERKIQIKEDDIILSTKESQNIQYMKRCFKGNDIVEGLFQNNTLKKGTQKYLDGSIFQGSFQNGIPFNGKLSYQSGIIFQGFFQHGKPNKGVATFYDNRIFQGIFDPLSDEICPLYGILKYPNGQQIKGYVNKMLKGNRPLKKGVFARILQFSDSSEKTYLNGDKFLGKFMGQIPKQGKILYQNGVKFEGILQDGRKPLKGQMTFKDNSFFQGKFLNGQLFQGRKYLPCGKYLEGVFDQIDDEGKMSGANIKAFYSNGDCIEANFAKQILIPGEYTKRYANRSQVRGYFQQEHDIIIGEKNFSRHKKFIGFFEGEKMKIGKLIFSNHSIFQGKLVDERPFKGKLSLAQGDKYEGRFNKDLELIGKGKIIFNNGDEYCGYLQNNLPEGRGTYTYRGGDKIECEWRKGKKHGTGMIIRQSKEKMRATWFEDKVKETFKVRSGDELTLNWQLYE